MKKQISKVYENTGLEQLKRRKPFNLSGGERKLLAFGMGLIHEPEILLFDEPFAGVDSQNSNVLMSFLRNALIKPDISVLIVEHKEEARQLFTRKVNMELGRIKNCMI